MSITRVEGMLYGVCGSKRSAGEASPVLRSFERERTLDGAAYILARAHQHKSWARRWLKQNGHWL